MPLHPLLKTKITSPHPFLRRVTTMTLGFVVIMLSLPCRAEPVEDTEFAAIQAEAKKSFRDGVTPFLKKYCMECHSSKRTKGGINFQPALSKPGDGAFAQHWKQALANVRAHDMPPDDADNQPTDEEREKFADWMGKMKFLSPKDPGPYVIRRLTKVEYGNTLHDFLGIDPEVAHELPDEVFGEGYMNTLSPLQSEQYLGIANEALDRALGPKD